MLTVALAGCLPVQGIHQSVDDHIETVGQTVAPFTELPADIQDLVHTDLRLIFRIQNRNACLFVFL